MAKSRRLKFMFLFPCHDFSLFILWFLWPFTLDQVCHWTQQRKVRSQSKCLQLGGNATKNFCKNPFYAISHIPKHNNVLLAPRKISAFFKLQPHCSLTPLVNPFLHNWFYGVILKDRRRKMVFYTTLNFKLTFIEPKRKGIPKIYPWLSKNKT